VLVCLLPLTNETRGLVGPRVLAALPMDAYIVNASRGAIVDEEAVASAIASGRLAGASLDVFAREPLPRESPLWTDTRILVTPHVAATPDPVRAARQLLDNLARARRGEPLLHLVDRSRGY
jgi:glyoxylate/hydroxypyruvate reductase A